MEDNKEKWHSAAGDMEAIYRVSRSLGANKTRSKVIIHKMSCSFFETVSAGLQCIGKKWNFA